MTVSLSGNEDVISEGKRPALQRGRFPDSRGFPASAKMRLPDKNVRPIGFLGWLLSSPPLPTGRQAQGGAF